MNFERQGSGDPLLLIHGIGGDLCVWAPVLDGLALLPGCRHIPMWDDPALVTRLVLQTTGRADPVGPATR